MKFKFALFSVVLVMVLMLFARTEHALAGSVPGRDQFGFGAWMDTRLAVTNAPSTTASSLALAIAAQSQMNWIALTLDWSAIAPQAESSPDFSGLAALVAAAEQQNMEILLSIQNPPAWTLTSDGPAPEHVRAFISQVSLVAANRIKVIELFPGANTQSSWKAPANPAAYLSVLQAARSALRANQQISLVIPGLTPIVQQVGPGDLLAENFLAALYQLAPNENFQVIGLHFKDITGNPADSNQPGESVFLRHYEIIRQVMLDNGRSSDQMWITAFAWPKSLAAEADQAVWVENAYRQLQGQIYIKAAFFEALYLGTSPNPTADFAAALLQPSLKAHAALARISALATHSATIGTTPADNQSTNQDGASPLAKLWEFLCSLFGSK